MRGFLEWFNETQISNTDSDLLLLNRVVEFYLTPFKPSLVEEYFDTGGLKTETIVDLLYDFDGKELPHAKTLDEFIYHIKSADISLTLKAEIKKEWFG